MSKFSLQFTSQFFTPPLKIQSFGGQKWLQKGKNTPNFHTLPYASPMENIQTFYLFFEGFPNVYIFRSHMTSHNNEMGNCDICGKEMRKVRIRKHKKDVHFERKYPCLQCNYRAINNFNLRLHVSKSHLGIKDLVKEQCQHCDVQTTNLERHVRIHHPEK